MKRSTAALAAVLLSSAITLGYAQSSGEPNVPTDNDAGGGIVDSSNSTGSIVGDTSTSDPGNVTHQDQTDSSAAPGAAPTGAPQSPCPSGLGTGNGDCR